MRYLKVYILFATMLLLIVPNIFASGDDSVVNQNKIDSLLRILPISEDNRKVDVLFSLSQLYLSISMDSSREYAKLALENAQKLNDNRTIAEAYKLLGNISYYKGEFNHVISFYDSSLTEYRHARDSFGQAKVLNNLGIIYQHIGDYRKSIDYHLQSLEFKKIIQDSIGIANSYNNIGSIYYDLKNFEKSSEYYNKALELSEYLGNQTSVQGILNNLGLISQDLGNIEKSIEYFKRSIEKGKKTGNLKGIATSYHNYGKSLFLSGRYAESLEYYNKVLEIYDHLGITNSQTLNNIGQLYLELDYYNKAVDYLERALANAKQNNQFTVISEIYQNLAVAFERMGNFEEAYYSYVQFHIYDDSVKNQIHSSRIEDLVSRNEMEKSREQLEKARLKIDKAESDMKRRNIVIYSVVAGLIGILIFALIILRLLKVRGKANVMLKQQNDEILRSQETIKKINRALTDSEATLRSIFDVSPFCIFVIDGQGNINDCNDTSLKMLRARKNKDLLDSNIGKFIASSNGQKQQDILLAVKSNRLTKVQHVVKRLDLSSFQAEITGRLIQKNNDNKATYIIVITDISERLEFIENLKSAKLKAEESDKLKTAFLTNMSHEIRTPMNSIIGFSNLLTNPQLDREKRGEYLSHILQSSNLLLNLIDDIIDISKIEAGQMNFNREVFALDDVLRERYQNFREINENPGIDIKLNLPESGRIIYCNTDILRLKQVLNNLFSNAIKFTSKGFIELGYTVDKQNDKLIAGLYMKDTGIGIPVDKHTVIFERFRQVDDSRTRSFGGTGLGLAICKRLVELMDGNIWVESEPGSGSTFYFTLPVSKSIPGKTDTEVKKAKHGYYWQGKTILVAEDENSNHELIRAILTSTGVHLIRAFNGEEAIEYVGSNPEIDLVLMDIRMPKINGYDATRKIKSINPGLPVLSITAYAMTEDESKSIEAGCDMYISKPIRPDLLLEAIGKYLQKRSVDPKIS